MSSFRRDPARQFLVLFGIGESLEWGFWMAATVWWVVDLGLSPLQLVGLGTATQLAVLIAETPTGVVADVVSRRRSLIIGQVIMSVAFGLAAVSTNFWLLLPAQALFGIGWTFHSGADTAWVTDELKGMGRGDDDEIDRLLVVRHRIGIGLGLVGMFLTLLVGLALSVRIALVSASIAGAVLAAVMAATMSEDHFTPGNEAGRGFGDTLKTGFAVVRSRPRLRSLVVVLVLLELGAEAVDRLGYKEFLDQIGLQDQSLVGIWVLFSLLGVGGFFANLVIGRALDRKVAVVRVAAVLVFIAAFGAALTAATPVVALIGLGLMLQDSTREALWPVLHAWANRDAPSEVRATVHSMLGQTATLGGMGGGLLLGAIAEAASIRVAIGIAAVMWLCAALVAVRQPSVPPEPTPEPG